MSLTGCNQSPEELQYTTPLYHADYTDPDVIRMGDDFYMVNSSFTYNPGLPFYHSRDLAHWQQISNVADLHYAERLKANEQGALANEQGALNVISSVELEAEEVYQRMNMEPGAVCSFSYGTDGEVFIPLAEGFQAKRLRWVGSSIGLYSFADGANGGSADFEWFRVNYIDPNL